MKDYPKKVYLSTSWRPSETPISNFLVSSLAMNNLTVVGDHPEYKKDDPFGRHWIDRTYQLLKDCSALAVVLPSRETIQTTSPYIFPEILAADHQGLPIIILADRNVAIKKFKAGDGCNLHFGGNAEKKTLRSDALFETEIDASSADTLLESITSIELRGTRHLDGPHLMLPDTDIRSAIDQFVENHVKNREGTYAFNIIPFSMKDREHVEISKILFEETGLPCYLAIDNYRIDLELRAQWRRKITDAEFVIAELSELRDTCIFEAGMVVGLEKEVVILTKKPDHIPFGLDDVPTLKYSGMRELREVVRTGCAKHKRKVYNFDADLPSEIRKNIGNNGIPTWFDHESRFSIRSYYLISSMALSLGFAGTLFFLLSRFLNLDVAVGAVFSLLPSAFTFIITQFREFKSVSEELFSKYKLVILPATGIFAAGGSGLALLSILGF